MSSDTPQHPEQLLPARLAAIHEQLQQVLPDVADLPLRRALLHAQSAVELRLGLPRDLRGRKRSGVR